MIDTINIVSKELANESNYSEVTIRKINAFYWKNLSKTISAGNDMTIRVKSIGSFTVSKYKLYKKIVILIRKIRFMDKPDTKIKRGVNKEEYVNKLYSDLKQLLILRNKLALHYQKTDYKNYERTN